MPPEAAIACVLRSGLPLYGKHLPGRPPQRSFLGDPTQGLAAPIKITLRHVQSPSCRHIWRRLMVFASLASCQSDAPTSFVKRGREMAVIIGRRFKVLVPAIVDFLQAARVGCRFKVWTPRSTPSKPPSRLSKATFSHHLKCPNCNTGSHSNAGQDSDQKRPLLSGKKSRRLGRWKYRRRTRPP